MQPIPPQHTVGGWQDPQSEVNNTSRSRIPDIMRTSSSWISSVMLRGSKASVLDGGIHYQGTRTHVFGLLQSARRSWARLLCDRGWLELELHLLFTSETVHEETKWGLVRVSLQGPPRCCLKLLLVLLYQQQSFRLGDMPLLQRFWRWHPVCP